MSCLYCGGTGSMVDGTPCSCGIKRDMWLPTSMKVPRQYQGVRFDSKLIPSSLDISYAHYMDLLLKECEQNLSTFDHNILICSPPNSGKTILAYTVLGMLYACGVSVVELMDIMELRTLIMDFYSETSTQKVELINETPILFVKIPQDLPLKMAETMSTIVERRVRRGHGTIFLFSGSEYDLIAQDRFGKLQALRGDGSFNSIEFKSWTTLKPKEGDSK